MCLENVSRSWLYFFVLVIKADGSSHHSISWRQYPTHKRNEVHEVKYHSIANGKSPVLADVFDACCGRQLMSFTTVIQHRKTVIITFNKQGDDGCYPAYHREKREYDQRNRINGLPQSIAQRQPDAACHIFHQLPPAKREIPAGQDGFRFLTQVSKQWRANDEEQVFEQGKIEEHQDKMDHDLPHHKYPVQDHIALFGKPAADADLVTDVGNGGIGRSPEKIHAHQKENGIQDAWNDDPLPQLVPGNKLVSPGIGLYSYYDFFKQVL